MGSIVKLPLQLWPSFEIFLTFRVSRKTAFSPVSWQLPLMKYNVFKMYHPKAEVEAAETRGQCWRGDTLEEGIELCRYQTIDRLFEKYLPRQGKILESGCGLGRWLFYLRKKGYDVTGIDLVEHAVHTAKAYDPEAACVCR